MSGASELVSEFSDLQRQWDSITAPAMQAGVTAAAALAALKEEARRLMIDSETALSGAAPDETLSVMSRYRDAALRARAASADVDREICAIWAQLSLLKDPITVIDAGIAEIVGHEDMEAVIEGLKADVRSEKTKSQRVSKLNEELNALKKEFHGHVELATKSTEAQMKVDFEVSLADYKDKLWNSQRELKNMENTMESLTSKRNSIVEKLRKKEIDVDNEISERSERLDTFENELKENEILLNEIEEKNSKNLDEESFNKLQKQCKECEEKLEDITSKCNEINTQKINNEAKYSSLMKEKSILLQSVETLRNTLNQLPSKDEWEKIKERYDSLELYKENEKIKNKLKEKYLNYKNELSQLKDDTSEITKQNMELKKQLNDEKTQIENIVSDNSSNSTTEAVNLLKLQKKSLEMECQQIDYKISQKMTNNTIKRKEKENQDLELINLKKQISQFAIQDPETLKYTTSKQPKMNLSFQSFLKSFATNRNFRTFINLYLIIIHLFLFLHFFN